MEAPTGDMLPGLGGRYVRIERGRGTPPGCGQLVIVEAVLALVGVGGGGAGAAEAVWHWNVGPEVARPDVVEDLLELTCRREQDVAVIGLGAASGGGVPAGGGAQA